MTNDFSCLHSLRLLVIWEAVSKHCPHGAGCWADPLLHWQESQQHPQLGRGISPAVRDTRLNSQTDTGETWRPWLAGSQYQVHTDLNRERVTHHVSCHRWDSCAGPVWESSAHSPTDTLGSECCRPADLQGTPQWHRSADRSQRHDIDKMLLLPADTSPEHFSDRSPDVAVLLVLPELP